MSRLAWLYIWTTLLTSAGLGATSLFLLPPATGDWLPALVLVLLAVGAQFFEAEAPNRQSYYPALLFFFAAAAILPPSLIVAVIAVPHLIEEMRRKLAGRHRPWYIQCFNFACHLLAALAAWGVQSLIAPIHGDMVGPQASLALVLSALAYLVVNHLLVGQALVLARNISWHESGVLAIDNLTADLVLILLGAVVAALWQVNPWLIGPALSPLVLMYRALQVPLLLQQAQTDSKTGLANVRYFNTQARAELERAARFNRPLALIVADLDLLREINNTHGHLAGDAVITGISKVIRQTAREFDLVGRFGGEEFILALPETTAVEAAIMAERIRLLIESTQFITAGGTTLSATMSFGIADFPRDGQTLEALTHAADLAVYAAKRRGRNQVVTTDELLDHERETLLANASD